MKAKLALIESHKVFVAQHICQLLINVSGEPGKRKEKSPSKAKPKQGSGVKRTKNTTLLMEKNKETEQAALASFAKTLSLLK